MSRSAHYTAIVPAAGKSLRMGSDHKLLMPWGTGRVIDQVLKQWTDSGVDRVIVTVRAEDADLQQACRDWDVELVLPETNPVDMKQSIQLALRHASGRGLSAEGDFWVLAPADLPTLQRSHIDRLIETSRGVSSIVAPRFGTRPGHPVVFPWSLVPEVFSLPADQGVNVLVENHPVLWVDFPASERPEDIDTPTDYERLRRRFS